MDFASYVYAMGTTGGTGTNASGAGWINLVFIASIFFIFYFILIRPQQKMRKQHNEMLTALKTGDKVVTTGGIYGDITGIDNNAVTIEIAPKVRIKITREAVSSVVK